MSDDDHPDGEGRIGHEAEFVDTSGNSKVLEVDMEPDRLREDIPGMLYLGRKQHHLEPPDGANRNGSDTGCRCLLIRNCVDSHLGLQSKWSGKERPGRHIWVWPNNDRGPEFGHPLALSLEITWDRKVHTDIYRGGGGGGVVGAVLTKLFWDPVASKQCSGQQD